MIEFVTIKESAEAEIVIKKSRFICALRRVETQDQAADEIAGIRKIHYNARHNCFAMILGADGQHMRASDDGEPQGTAGVPMLEVLQKSGLTDILAVVTRYFGGTLLGAGGLVRAYGGSVAEALKQAKRVRNIPADVYEFTVDYADYGKLCSVAAEFDSVPEVVFEETVRAKLAVEQKYAGQFQDRVTQAFLGAEVYRRTGERYIEKKVENGE